MPVTMELPRLCPLPQLIVHSLLLYSFKWLAHIQDGWGGEEEEGWEWSRRPFPASLPFLA